MAIKNNTFNSEKTIYTVATAHLDTVWNWDFERTVSEYILRTLTDNFKAFEKFPDYEFSFEGSFRYELMEEYYPELFEKLKEYVKKGRWHLCGSAYENGDVNVPSPEALFRNILYGNSYFDKTFGIRSKDIFLPDCFGFGWALPSIIKHSNLLGFTTQKLTWGSAYGVPFDIGRWIGVNGKWCYASLNPGCYVFDYKKIRDFKFLADKLKENEKFGLDCTYSFHGVGDRGGAANDASIKVLEKEIGQNGSSKVKVVSAAADEIYRDFDEKFTKEQIEKLPTFNNELVMTNHAVGGYTSRVIGKRWNKRNEELADMCERASVAAMILNQKPYAKEQIDRAWKRVIAHQFHDDLPGTSIERAYQRSWNDYAISLNQFSNEYTASISAVVGIMNTNVDGIPIIVNNSLEFERTEAVTAFFTSPNINFIKVFDSDNNEVPSQIIKRNGDKIEIAFTATVPSLGTRVYNVKNSDKPCLIESGLAINEKLIENIKYSVEINHEGDISSIFDKTLGKEILKAPIRLCIYNHTGDLQYPAWELVYKELVGEPGHYAKAKASAEIIENGPCRVALKVMQYGKGSTFCYVVSLSECGECVEIMSEIEWRSRRSLLKTQFSFTASNKKATYDLGIGVIERENSKENLYEVPAQKWVDLTDKNNSFGVSVFSNSKCGWDKIDDNTVRMTVVHTPRFDFRKDTMQSFMDLGLNRYGFSIYSHENNYSSKTQNFARAFTAPMATFISNRHEGSLGFEYSMGEISDSGVMLKAIKKAENTDEIVVRFYEGENKSHKNVELKLSNNIKSAREIFASEEEIRKAKVKDGKLIFNIDAFDVKSFALTLEPSKIKKPKFKETQINLPYNTKIATTNSEAGANFIDNTEFSLPFELLPATINAGETTFKMADGMIARGQKIVLPQNTDKVFILASSIGRDKHCSFTVGNIERKGVIHSALERIGGWDLYHLKEMAFMKNVNTAFEITHTHSVKGDDVARQFLMFKYEVPINSANEITMPNDEDIIIFALTATTDTTICRNANKLYDTVGKRKYNFLLNPIDSIANHITRVFLAKG
ncbi:MAG: glycoside hydrolase family 38 C-terminal domain-containing protein [Oscillospiraceae bacterium]